MAGQRPNLRVLLPSDSFRWVLTKNTVSTIPLKTFSVFVSTSLLTTERAPFMPHFREYCRPYGVA